MINHPNKVVDNVRKNNFTNKYSQKIINELEQTLQQNIQNNCNIIDTILKMFTPEEAIRLVLMYGIHSASKSIMPSLICCLGIIV